MRCDDENTTKIQRLADVVCLLGIDHVLELYIGRHGNHAISHHPNDLMFENNIFLHVSDPND